MAAGLGFKDFATGEVLTAADVDGYLMQGVWVFASATARDAAVTSPQEGNFAYLKDTNVTTYYTGSAWANLDTTGMTNPMTTTGDTIYSSSGSTPARLGIGTAGQVLKVNSGATAPEWGTAGGGYTPDMFKAVNTSGQAFSSSTWTKLTGWTESYDIGSDFATPTWTCPATGYYTFTTGCRIYGGGIGTGVISSLALYKNGSIIHRVSCDSVSDIGQVLTATLQLAATDTIEVYVRSELTSPNTAGSEGAIWFEGQFIQS